MDNDYGNQSDYKIQARECSQTVRSLRPTSPSTSVHRTDTIIAEVSMILIATVNARK